MRTSTWILLQCAYIPLQCPSENSILLPSTPNKYRRKLSLSEPTLLPVSDEYLCQVPGQAIPKYPSMAY